MDEDQTQSGPRLKEARHAAQGILNSAGHESGVVEIKNLMVAVKQAFPDLTIAGLPGTHFRGKGDAMTQRRGNSIFIIYNEDMPIVRKRFSVAHEIGHLFMGHLHGNSSLDLNTQNYDELEAHAFAAELLMPPKLLKLDIKDGIKKPEELAKKYNVSVEALWIQLRNAKLLSML